MIRIPYAINLHNFFDCLDRLKFVSNFDGTRVLLLEVVSVRVAGHSALAVDSAGHVKGFDLRSCAVCSVLSRSLRPVWQSTHHVRVAMFLHELLRN